MLKFQLPSGKLLELNLAPIGQALALYRAIVYECKNAGLDLNIEAGATIADLLLKNTNALLSVIGSELVMEAVKDCAVKVLYDRQKFSMEIFEGEKSRGDFFNVMAIIALENIRPFFPQAASVFNAIESQFLTD